jgi:hypothetical protein
MYPLLTNYRYHAKKISQAILIFLQRMRPLLTKYHYLKKAQALLISPATLPFSRLLAER